MLKDALANLVRIPDLRSRLIFTASMLAIYRVGSHIPVPGVDPAGLAQFWGASGAQGVFGMLDMFSGGAFAKFSLFSLGIMPYINASIIIQLLTVVFPDSLGKLAKEGEAGKAQITKYTRYLTVGLAILQGSGLTWYMMQESAVVPNPGMRFFLITVLSLATGTAFIMWVGEQITERGIGNGISIIISAGIIAALPSAAMHTWSMLKEGDITVPALAFLAAVMLATTAATVIMTTGTRKVPIQYARQIRGRRVFGGTSQFLPLRVNAAGVIPVIFAQALLSLPTMAAGVMGAANDPDSWMGQALLWLAPGSFLHESFFVLGIVFFTFFYTAIIFNPDELADNLKRSGGAVPGIRPGKPTSEHIEWIIMRITLAGSIFLALICLLPQLLIVRFGVPFYFGGTALLIVVGVQLDTIKQLESHLLSRHYDGLLSKGRVRGRQG